MELLNFIFQGFWHFVGSLILLSVIGHFIFLMWNRFWRHWTLRANGYPPEHCDADGDFRGTETEEVEGED